MGEGEFWIRKESLVVLIVDLYDVPILLAGRIVSLCKSNSHIKIILHRFCTLWGPHCRGQTGCKAANLGAVCPR